MDNNITIYQYIIQFILPQIISTGIIGILFSFLFNKRLERFKYELNKDYTEYQIRFSKLHEKRAVVIEELYHKLIDATASIRNYFQPLRYGKVDMDILLKDTVDSLNVFIEFYKHNDIYFEKGICDKLDEMIQIIYELFGQKEKNSLLIEEITAFPDTTDDVRQELNVGKKRLRDLSEKAMTENLLLIGNEFRKIIGVS